MEEVTKAGWGKPGYCKICDSPFLYQVNFLLNEKKNSAEIARALAPFNFTFDRATLRKHREHSSDPKTTFVKKAQEEGAVRTVSNEEYLARIRDAAARNLEQAPHTVTVDQGIKATAVLMQDRNQRDTLKIVLMKTMTGRSHEVIEGDWSEIKELTTDGAADAESTDRSSG